MLAPLPAAHTVVRKVEIHDAYDLKRWWWRGTDGIRETTWPGVYNRSRLVGRFDYFQLPDWDCYSLSGKSVTFYMPNEPWNHLEIQGGAWGNVSLLMPGGEDSSAIPDSDQHDPSPMLARTLFERPRGQERTTHHFAQTITGEKVRFTNAEQEWPIGEFAAYYVHAGEPPAGVAVLRYTLSNRNAAENPSLAALVDYIHGRFPEDQRATMVAMPEAVKGKTTEERTSLPIVHILVPADFRALPTGSSRGTVNDWENLHAGLDGIAIDLPPLNIKPTHGDYVPMNIQVKDPIWPMRDLLDFSFSIKPGEPYTIFLDTRDRILPNGKSLYLTLASASEQFGPKLLEGAHVRLIFKPWKDALAEHTLDRLTQVRDNYANLVEESVGSRKLNIFNRFDADITDLLRVDPENDLGRKYWHEMNAGQPGPPFTLPATPEGVPQWASLQTEDLGQLKRLINWYVDNRQISNGEFGGGLSDDSDFLNWWPGLAFMGATPDKLKASLLKTLDTMYAQNMFTNGLATGQFDELHSYEDGLNVLGQAMMLDFGSPRQLERAMESSRRLEWLTGINSAGQRQVRSSYYSGAKMAEGGVWGWGKSRSYMVFHPALSLVLFNGTPRTRTMMEQIADGFLAHRHADADGKYSMHYTVNFHTNEDLPGSQEPAFILWAAYRWTGDKKYLVGFGDDPVASLRSINSDALDILNVRDTWGKKILEKAAPDRRDDAGNARETRLHFAWQLSGNTDYLDQLYASQIETAADREFINREGSLWIHRVYFNSGELQRARLGGVALMRNYVYPGNVVSWRFDAPANDQSVALLIPEGTPGHIRITAFNLDPQPVTAHMTGWEIDPGKWEITQGGHKRTEDFERSRNLTFTFAPRTTTVIELKLVKPGIPYWSRPDLGIDREDVKVNGSRMSVTVHSLGSVDAPAARVVLRDREGKVLAAGRTPRLKAPVDLLPKTATVTLTIPSGAKWKGGSLRVESSGSLPEITQMNNQVQLN